MIRLLSYLPLVAILLASCGGGGSNSSPVDDDGASGGSSTATTGESTDESASGGPPGNVLNSENVSALVLQAFEIYSGRAYDNRLNVFAYDFDSDALCDNEGSLSVTDTGLSAEDCALGSDTVSGMVSQSIDSAGIDRNFENFQVLIGNDGTMKVSGRHYIACCTPVNSFGVDNFNYVFDYSGGFLEVDNATTVQHIEASRGAMSGSFSMNPPSATGHSFDVSITREFSFEHGANLSTEDIERLRTQWLFQTGELLITAADGSHVVVSADTGDDQTLSITITNSDGESTVVENWDSYGDALRWSPGAQLGSYTRDNSVGILNEVFAYYSGQGYMDVLHTLPGYSDEQYVSGPDFRPNETDENGFGDPISVDCSGGGIAIFTPLWENYARFTRYGWDYKFDTCVDGANTLQGSVFIDNRSSIFTYVGDGLNKELPDGSVQLSGTVSYNPYGVYGCEDCKFWVSENLELDSTSAAESSKIANGNTVYTYNGPGYRIYSNMFGSISIRTPATNDQWVHSNVLEEFEFDLRVDEPGYTDETLQNYTVGRLELRSDSGDVLVLNANNGDVRTAHVTLSSPGISTEYTHYWSIWFDNLQPVLERAPIAGY